VRLAIVSDTHLSDPGRLPEGCLEAIREADATIHAGDISTAPVLAAISRASRRLHAVHGNVDAPELLRGLPAELTLSADGVRLGVIHDAGPARGRLARMRRRFPEAAAVVFGHSHMPLIEEEGGFQIFNPGSPTQRRRAPRHTIGTAVVEGGAVRFEHVFLD
jgi:uncharacterized protein